MELCLIFMYWGEENCNATCPQKKGNVNCCSLLTLLAQILFTSRFQLCGNKFESPVEILRSCNILLFPKQSRSWLTLWKFRSTQLLHILQITSFCVFVFWQDYFIKETKNKRPREYPSEPNEENKA